MRQTNSKPSRQLAWLEQIAVLAGSLVWTAIVLLIISFVWAYQDAQARWEMLRAERAQSASMSVAMLPPEAPLLIEDSDTPTANPSLSSTPTPTNSATPTPTNSPTPTATSTIEPTEVPPEILPETPLEVRATPTSLPAEEPSVEPTASPTSTLVPPTSTATPTPIVDVTPTNTPVPTAPPSAPADGESGPPSRVVIKSVGIDTPVIPVGWSVVEQNGQEYRVWDVADYASGWHNTSALPGQPGNTVLSGHHNIKGEVFRYLVDVQEGDKIDLYVGDTAYSYYVQQRLIVKEKDEPVDVRQQNAQWIAPSDDTRLTLVTCWPYTNNTHRVILVAKPGP